MPLKFPPKSKAASAAGLSPARNPNPALRTITPKKHTIKRPETRPVHAFRRRKMREKRHKKGLKAAFQRILNSANQSGMCTIRTKIAHPLPPVVFRSCFLDPKRVIHGEKSARPSTGRNPATASAPRADRSSAPNPESPWPSKYPASAASGHPAAAA